MRPSFLLFSNSEITKFSNIGENGIGVFFDPIIFIGESRKSKAFSYITDAISAPTPHLLTASWQIKTLPVFLTDFITVS